VCSKHVASEFARYTPETPPSRLLSASRTFGSIGLLTSILPVVGFPLTFIGLALGIASLRGAERGKAVRACLLCGVGLLLSVATAAAGYYLYTNGGFATSTEPQAQQILNPHYGPHPSAATSRP
jgi:hypothetical protein